MIPYDELTDALARWRGRKTGAASRMTPTDAEVRYAEADAAAGYEPSPEPTGELDVDNMDVLDETPE